MGEVYLAERKGEAVAVKLLKPSLATDEDAIKRLADEAEALGRVDHDNVVKLEDAGRGWIAMAWAPGRTLSDVIADESPLPLERAINLADQVLAGLEAAHAAGVVHGDLKSDNILVEELEDGGERVRLVDFGLARLLDGPADVANRASGSTRNALYGTPEYLAPELILGCAPSPASDIYAVGCLLFELLAGQTPFAGGRTVDVLQSHLHEPVSPMAEHCPVRTVPGAVERLVAQALEKRPVARVSSATAFRQGLVQATTRPRLSKATGRVVKRRKTARVA